jgi:hypothetical protein
MTVGDTWQWFWFIGWCWSLYRLERPRRRVAPASALVAPRKEKETKDE